MVTYVHAGGSQQLVGTVSSISDEFSGSLSTCLISNFHGAIKPVTFSEICINFIIQNKIPGLKAALDLSAILLESMAMKRNG